LPDPRGRVREIAAAIAAHDPAVACLVGDTTLDRRQQDLGGEPALGEDDRRDLLPQKPEGELRRFTKIRRPDAELFVDDRRVVADEDLVARRGAALRDLLDRLPPHPAGPLPPLCGWR